MVTMEDKQQKPDITIYSVFAFLWAMCLIWHYLRPENNYPVRSGDLMVILPSILVLVRPKNVYFLFIAAWGNVFVYLNAQPSISNHWMLQFFVNLTLVISFILVAIRNRSIHIDADDWLKSFRPIVMIIILILYFYAVLHKLNEGYLSNSSWSITLYRELLFANHLEFLYPILPKSELFLDLLPELSLILEALIPLSLLFKRTRVFGIILGFSFHGFLSIRELPPATDFPISLGAAYILFFPNSSPSLMNPIMKKITNSQIYRVSIGYVLPSTILAILFIPYIRQSNNLDTGINLTFANLRATHWGIYVFIYLCVSFYILYRVRFQTLADQHVTFIGETQPVLLWIPIILLLVGFSPYLGLRTHSAFAMYSNLETEGHYVNHLFIPESFQVFDYQKQVCVIETSSNEIPLSAHTGELFTYYDFRKLTIKNPDASIIYTFDGERYELEKIADKSELVAPLTPFERAYLTFQDTNWKNRTTYCNYRW